MDYSYTYENPKLKYLNFNSKRTEEKPVASAQLGTITTIGSMIMNPGIQDIVKSATSIISNIIHTSHAQHHEQDMIFIKTEPYRSEKNT